MHHIVEAPTAERLEAPDCLVVRTSSGRVRGTVVEFSINGTQYSTVAFYGIPFARPPAGSRRFMMPASARPWKAVFNATQKRPPCKQLHTRFPKNYVINASNTTEECLHINIWVPGRCVDPTSMRAAMFWLYGGSFAHGGNSYDFYDGRFVSALGDLVVAAPNYRVSLFGFLNSGTGHVEGNMGLHDQVLALRWVRENIGRFGGDRGNVLLAGNSAGSISLSLLMASPLGSPHTFRRLYLMSGSMYTPMPDNEGDRARRTFDAIADGVDCRSENATMSAVVRCLQGRDASALLEASKNFSLNLMPSREGPLLPVGNLRLGDRDFGHLEVIFTTTLNEGMAFFEMMFPQFQGRKQTDAKETVNEALRGRLGNFTDEMADFMLDILRHALYDIDDPDYAGWANLIGDVLIRCPTERLASDLSKRGAQVYYQVYEPKLSFTTFGGAKATHGEDVLIMFGAPYLYPFLATDDERSMSQRMIETLANFTMTG
ncbi:hypothetical protein V5799_014506 [Amblyomma americanum]|uniref:Carboxylic ester hydrolase n=1 Tax=Amblyomma americanum TaxID=6943 RepID=A0AAQ4E2U4_AMBAM